RSGTGTAEGAREFRVADEIALRHAGQVETGDVATARRIRRQEVGRSLVHDQADLGGRRQVDAAGAVVPQPDGCSILVDCTEVVRAEVEGGLDLGCGPGRVEC